MIEKHYPKIAELLLAAVDFHPGDKINLKVEYDQREAALAVLKAAYAGQAAYVHLDYTDSRAQAMAIGGRQEAFWFPDYLQAMISEVTEPGWKRISIFSQMDPDAFQGVDQARFARYFKAQNKAYERQRRAIMGNHIPWTVTYLPSQATASKSFPGLTPDAALEAYQRLIVQIMHLDEADPVEFWRNKMTEDARRSDFMTGLDPDYLHFEGPGTDLRVGLLESARWIGGFDLTRDGRQFLANIPTDEIFTSPDYRRIDGRVRLTRPFVMHQNLGPAPEEAWFEFKDGRVEDYGAAKGKESLDAFFATDDRARYLGEVALVDPRSPFAAPGIVYCNGLYDENAACHLALGNAYSSTLKEPRSLSDEELLKLGYNVAGVHEDMMIGGPDVNVTAVLKNGSRVPVIKEGAFVI